MINYYQIQEGEGTNRDQSEGRKDPTRTNQMEVADY